MQKTKRMSTETMVYGAVLTAMVVLLQLIATYTTFFGPFSTAIGLIPIVVGAAKCGPKVSAWLGFVFAMVVLLTGGAALFLAFSIPGTIITVVGKGIACGLVAGFVYKLLSKKNFYVAVIAESIVCPIVNTAVFLLGCAVFFLPYAEKIAETAGMAESGFSLFIAMATGNFLFELCLNMVLGPVIVRLLNIANKKG